VAASAAGSPAAAAAGYISPMTAAAATGLPAAAAAALAQQGGQHGALNGLTGSPVVTSGEFHE